MMKLQHFLKLPNFLLTSAGLLSHQYTEEPYKGKLENVQIWLLVRSEGPSMLVFVSVQHVSAGHLSHKALVIDGCLGVVAGTQHMFGCSRVTDDQEAAGRACMHTPLLNS